MMKARKGQRTRFREMRGGPICSRIWAFLFVLLLVDGDEWELGESGQHGTYLGPAVHVAHAAHVVKAHNVYDSE